MENKHRKNSSNITNLNQFQNKLNMSYFCDTFFETYLEINFNQKGQFTTFALVLLNVLFIRY